MGVKLNLKKLRKEISESKAARDAVEKAFKKQLENRQDKLLTEFNEHPVTQEIELGNGSPNISRTLGGYGNLFTFLGFEEDSDPIKIVRDYLAQEIKYRITKSSVDSRGFRVYFKVEIPGIKDLTTLTYLSHLGRSWLTGVEQGKVDGFQYYLNRWRKMRGSRSGKGVQIDNKLRNSNVKPVAYVNNMLKKFRASLERIK